MSKLILPTLGLGGAGAAGFGAYMLIPRDAEITFAVKYKNAILNPTGDESLWNSKFTSLNGKTVKHLKLQSAVTQHSSNSENAKALHKEACKDIYNSPFENSDYQKDFQDYCARNLKDEIGSKWITEEKGGSKWTARLTSLKSHSESNGELDDTLKGIKTSISNDNNNTFDDTKRENLKNWCTSAGAEIFNSTEDARFKLVKLYCSEP
ncbi:hypothetical protein HF1_08630 [Mycoplasma haemofelis str. Langford 1]|uniref:Uncharacterized protein n=2 Tax=Mycoplasma haemofelis TaxID=29501 RepID=F6FJ01_MYCHI|nr:hypothetical protein [Mycoplasma haemofelis]AEG73199.1 hypothetical protein MHF_0942 [Mycoplasma haemofelis Ohio2]CBY92871.1 hypothetical protein HF1_08630 [Mycoplasma haemofelis str. Langford 1]